MGRIIVCGLLAAATLAANTCGAVEGGVGRSFIGAQITPYVGIVPPEPGFLYSFNYIYLDGTIGGGRQVPIAGELALNLDAKFQLYAASSVSTPC